MRNVKEYFLWVLAVAGLSIRLSPLCVEFVGDSTVYHTGAWLMLHGKLPYVGFWDHKPPLFYVIYAVAELLGGRWGYWALECIVFAGTLMLLCRVLRAEFSDSLAWSSTIALLLMNRFLFLTGTGTPEQWGLIVSMVLFTLVLRKNAGVASWLLAGVLGGAVFFIKPTCIMLPFSVGIIQLAAACIDRSKNGFIKTFTYAGGAAGALAVGFVTIFSLGFFQEFWQACIQFNGAYAANSIARTGLQEHVTRLLETCSQNGYYILVGFVLSAGILLGNKKSRGSFGYLYAICIVSIIIETVFISMTGRYYGHYFLVATLPASLCFGYAASNLMQTVNKKTAIAFLLPAALPFIVWVFYLNVAQGIIKGGFVHAQPLAVDAKILKALKDAPVGGLFVWGSMPAKYYYLSGRMPASRFIFCYPLWTPSIYQSEFLKVMLSDLKANPPVAIIDCVKNGSLSSVDNLTAELYYEVSANDLLGLRSFVTEGYTAASVDKDFVLYLRN